MPRWRVWGRVCGLASALAAKATGAFDVLIVGNVVAIGVVHGQINSMHQFSDCRDALLHWRSLLVHVFGLKPHVFLQGMR